MADLGAAGGYRFVRRLAAGATSEVFVAERADGAPREVVVKRLVARLAADPEARRLIERERKVLARARHPGIAALLAAGEEGGVPYLVLERAEGEALSALRARQGGAPLPLDAALGIVAQLGAALHHVHELRGPSGAPWGVVHRDVAPDNVIVASDGRVKLVDFGIAALAADTDTRPRGSPGYMAPEQVLGSAVDRRADLFALGALLYELATGRNPFGDSALARTTAVVEREVVPPSAVAAGIPPMLDALVLDALARSVERRPATVAAWCAGLAAFAADARLTVDADAVAAWVAGSP